MTITADTYIQNISTTGQTNPSWTITFPVFDEEDIWVWKVYTATGVLEKLVRGQHYEVTIDDTTGTLKYYGVTDNYTTSTLRVQRHMKRVQQDEFKTGNANATTLGYQRALDKMAMMNQQSLEIDPLQPEDWTAKGDAISNVADGSETGDAVTKSQVDTALGGGTTPPTIASEDVGQWLTANASGGYSWEAFSGTDDPKGQEYKHYTVQGWKDIGENLPTIAGSADNGKLLMDVGGTATWVTAKEWLTSFDDSPLVKANKPYSIVEHSSRGVTSYVPSVRDYAAAPDLLPNAEGQRLTALETGYSAALNKLEFGRVLKITEHSVVCRRRPEGSSVANYYNGLGESSDHAVYVGTVSNLTGSTSCFPFFNSHQHVVPDDYSFNGGTETRWWTEAYGGWMYDGGAQMLGAGFSYVFNIISITTSTITFAAASLLHESSPVNGDFDPGLIRRFMKHGETATINFNVLWYQQKT